MLGVSQPSNPPTSLRHSASFSCLQRSSGDVHRSRTSTLPQQPNQFNANHRYNHFSPLNCQQKTCDSSSSADLRKQDDCHHHLDGSNDYGFVCIRPRLRSTNAVLYREESQDDSRSHARSEAVNKRDYRKSYRNSYQQCSSAEDKSRDCRNQNPLRGALILFSTSTSSWWKNKPREDLNSSAASCTKRNKSTNTANTAPSTSTSPAQSQKWPDPLVSPSKERKWPSISNPSSSEKSRLVSNRPDRRWRSLGALLRTPTSSSSQSRSSQTSFHQPAGSSGEPADAETSRYNSQSGSAYLRRALRDDARFSSSEKAKVSSRLFLDDDVSAVQDKEDDQIVSKEPFEDDARSSQDSQIIKLVDHNTEEVKKTLNRSSNAQSFYLLDDFLRPQPQQIGSTKFAPLLNLYSSSPHSPHLCSADHRNRSEEAKQPTLSTVATQRIVSNITPPRRHNSSSDSLEVATSPLPPPVPPPPPQICDQIDKRKRRDTALVNHGKESEHCFYKFCWTGDHRTLSEEVSTK